MIWIPLLGLGAGMAIGIQNLPAKLLFAIDFVSASALLLLMLIIGINIGTSETVMMNISRIGFNCLVIASTAIGFSILFAFILEKTIFHINGAENWPRNVDYPSVNSENDAKSTSLNWVMPVSVISGVLLGRFIVPRGYTNILEISLAVCLVIVCNCIGINLGSNPEAFQYMKQLNRKILILPFTAIAGSLVGGFVTGFLLNLPLYITVISASGLGCYSMTGVFMSGVYGVETGTYGFMVNVFREFLTVLFLPVIVRISKTGAIVSAGTGSMAELMAPVIKFSGKEFAFAALYSGTVLTFFVPVLLSLLAKTYPL